MTVFLSACCVVLPAFAATRDELKKVESEMSRQKEEAATLETKAREANENLKDLQKKLIDTTEALQAKSEEQEALEDKLDDLTQDIDAKRKELRAARHKLTLLTEGLIELSRQPPETEFLQNDLTSDHIHRAILLRAAAEGIKEEADIVAHDIETLNVMQEQLAEQKHLVLTAQDVLEGQEHDLDQLIKARQGLLQRTEAQKEAIAKQLTDLSSQATDLRQLMEKVVPNQKEARPSKGGSLPGPLVSLKAPVAGTLIRGFGAKDSDGVMSEGLTYKGLPGGPVVAPRAGKVVFAGPFRGYGQALILQHESGYYSFLSGFGHIDVEMGQDVAAGEPLGVLPVRQGGKPELYFEWRRNNEPVDPARGIALSKNE